MIQQKWPVLIPKKKCFFLVDEFVLILEGYKVPRRKMRSCFSSCHWMPLYQYRKLQTEVRLGMRWRIKLSDNRKISYTQRLSPRTPPSDCPFCVCFLQCRGDRLVSTECSRRCANELLQTIWVPGWWEGKHWKGRCCFSCCCTEKYCKMGLGTEEQTRESQSKWFLLSAEMGRARTMCLVTEFYWRGILLAHVDQPGLLLLFYLHLSS